MEQKGFINVILVVAAVALIGIVGYFVFVRKSVPAAETPSSTQSPASTEVSHDEQSAPVPTPANEPSGSEQMLEELVSLLRSGNRDAAIKKFASERDGRAISSLDARGLQRLADFYASRRIIKKTPNRWIYMAKAVEDDGLVRDVEFGVIRDEVGEWKISY